MAVLLILAITVAIDVAAVLYGVDSRPGIAEPPRSNI
jgi:hypothetical protein